MPTRQSEESMSLQGARTEALATGADGGLKAVPTASAERPLSRRDITALLGAGLGALTALGATSCAEGPGTNNPAVNTLQKALSGSGLLQYADSVAELRTIIGGSVGWFAILNGYSRRGDGGGGVFNWDEMSAADDGGTVLNYGAGNSAGWRRVYSGPVNVAWFGAVGVPSDSDIDAIEDAVALGKPVVLNKGTYKLTRPLIIAQSSVSITGAGIDKTTIDASGIAAGAGAAIQIGTTAADISSCILSSFQVVSSSTPSTADGGIAFGSNSYMTFAHKVDGVGVKGFSKPGGYGIRATNVHWLDISKCRLEYCDYCFHIPQYAMNITLILIRHDTKLEKAYSYGAYLEGHVQNFVMDRVTIEGSEKDGLRSRGSDNFIIVKRCHFEENSKTTGYSHVDVSGVSGNDSQIILHDTHFHPAIDGNNLKLDYAVGSEVKNCDGILIAPTVGSHNPIVTTSNTRCHFENIVGRTASIDPFTSLNAQPGNLSLIEQYDALGYLRTRMGPQGMLNSQFRVRQTTSPTIAVNANAGTGATTAFYGGNPTDMAGRIILTTGSGGWAGGIQLSVTFNKNYPAAPHVIFCPAGSNAADAQVRLGVYVSTRTDGFDIRFVYPDIASLQYVWAYHVIG